MGVNQAFFDPADNRGGAGAKHARRTIVNAIFYLNKTGVQWRLLSREFPPWKTVYDRYSQWNRRGVWDWEKVMDQLDRKYRKKRHIVVDTMGNLVQVIVHAANVHDTKGGCDVLKSAAGKYPALEAFSGDAGYRGTAVEFVENTLQRKLHISKKIKDAFAVLPVRWIVERTFAWLGNFRRLSRDYEILANSTENMVRTAMIQITIASCV
ncbi:putative transposase [Nitrosomonas sp. Nm51]|uniref:transposase n=1 Tax=Nitrosomonas sp. Nm51 TaxID=133720 RepID=UPI0008BEC7CE|nr:transposase [Nitrosomonas sp. Nm51]SER04254.1 putative transposase [Nitrosomonas sp. Nm51]